MPSDSCANLLLGAAFLLIMFAVVFCSDLTQLLFTMTKLQQRLKTAS